MRLAPSSLCSFSSARDAHSRILQPHARYVTCILCYNTHQFPEEGANMADDMGVLGVEEAARRYGQPVQRDYVLPE